MDEQTNSPAEAPQPERPEGGQTPAAVSQAGALSTLLKSGGCKWLGILSLLSTALTLPRVFAGWMQSGWLEAGISMTETLVILFFDISWLLMYRSPAEGARIHRRAALISMVMIILTFVYSGVSNILSMNTLIAIEGADAEALSGILRGARITVIVLLAALGTLYARFYYLRFATAANIQSCMEDLPWARERAGKAKGYCMGFFVLHLACFGILLSTVPASLQLLTGEALTSQLKALSLSSVLYIAGLILSPVICFMEYLFYKAAQELGL